MSERFVDLENSNLYLFNLLFRHQVYLEGVKTGFAIYFRRMLTELYGEFAKFIGQSKYDTLDGFTRNELKHFIFRFQQAQTRVYNQYTQQLIGLLQDFMAADVEVSQAIYKAVNEHPASKPVLAVNNGDVPQLGTTHANNLLWIKIVNEIVPANGLTLGEMVKSFGDSTVNQIASRLNAGYANNETLREAFAAIAGTQDSRFRDGLFASFTNQNNAIIATALQHVSSMTQSAVAVGYYSKYQWVAILDSKTTIICRSRNGNVYVYGEGPLPPAHWFCRSKAVSLSQGDALHDLPDTFYDWVTTQPENFLVDALGATLAAKLLAKDVSVKDISVNQVANPLTVTQFKDKISLITM